MARRLSLALQNALATAFATAFADGAIYVYSGPQPSAANDAPTGTLLFVISQDAGAWAHGSTTNGLDFAAASAGAVAKTNNWKGVGIAAGVAGWFRFKGNPTDSNGAGNTTNMRLDGSVGTSGADLVVSTVNIEIGTPVTVDIFSWLQPAS